MDLDDSPARPRAGVGQSHGRLESVPAYGAGKDGGDGRFRNGDDSHVHLVRPRAPPGPEGGTEPLGLAETGASR
ncbi:hypothetical protein SBD_1852 [Streptomyces bottropensis ATCC 25435]|uniref:Uncharacterized protein n=1 Tax=Streptomyces bottropensis ATCC 25435 TaxID=1054862 RepID=M3FX23_9ACTN|nr:hypothetical protein SBD_1852 [Streptomyces bottropensis ATCC 25435]